MDSIKELAKLVAHYIKGETTKTKPYDTAATVKRIENGTAYVQIPGGVAETPVKLTIDAKEGDVVQVHVANGTAWLVGNSTAPPTDDAEALIAKAVAKLADTKATNSVEIAEDAKEMASTADAKSDQNITTDTMHYLATNTDTGVTTSTPGWSTTIQTITESNPYLWTYHTYTKANGQSADTTPVVTGVFGADGQMLYALCTTAAATAAKVGTLTPAVAGFTLETGMMVVVNFSNTNSSSSATFNLNNTGAYPVRYKNGTALTSTTRGYLAANRLVVLQFDGTYWEITASTTDANNYDRTAYKASLTATAPIASGRIGVLDANGKIMLLTTTPFDTTGPILYIGTAYTADALTQTNNYTMWGSAFNLANTKAGFTGTAGKAVFIKGTLSGKMFTPDAEIFTTTTPNSADGKVYILLGLMSTTTNAVLNAEHPMYAYGANGFEIMPGATGAQGVSVTSLQTQYYLSTSSSSATGGSWSDTPQTFVHGKYYWTREHIYFSNSSDSYSTAVYNAALTDANEEAYAAKTQAEGINQYFWTKSTGGTTDIPTGSYVTEVPQDEFTDSGHANYCSGGNLILQSSAVKLRVANKILAELSTSGLNFYEPNDSANPIAQYSNSGVVIGKETSGNLRTTSSSIDFYDSSTKETSLKFDAGTGYKGGSFAIDYNNLDAWVGIRNSGVIGRAIVQARYSGSPERTAFVRAYASSSESRLDFEVTYNSNYSDATITYVTGTGAVLTVPKVSATDISTTTINGKAPFTTVNKTSSSSTLSANGGYNTYTIDMTSAIPSGYTMIGITGVTTNHSAACHIGTFYIDGSSVKVVITNRSNASQSTTVTAYVLCTSL